MKKLEDLISKKKHVVVGLDLSRNVTQTKEEFKRLMEKVPDYKTRPIKVRAEEIKLREHDFSFQMIKREIRKLTKANGEREPSCYYPDPVPCEMSSVIFIELCWVPIDWKMLTTLRPKLKQEEQLFSRMVEMGKLYLKTEARNRRDHIFNNCVKKMKNKSGIVETRLLMCSHCGEEMCNDKGCIHFGYDLFGRIELKQMNTAMSLNSSKKGTIKGYGNTSSSELKNTSHKNVSKK